MGPSEAMIYLHTSQKGTSYPGAHLQAGDFNVSVTSML